MDTGVGYRAKTIEGIARVFTEKRIPPVDDLQKMDSRDIEARWLKKIVSKVYGVDEKSAEDIWRGIWGVWSGLAAIALTVTLDAAPLREALARIERGELLPKIDSGPSPVTLWRYTTIVKRRRICK